MIALERCENEIPKCSKFAALLSTDEVSDIREHTFLDPNLLIGGIIQPNGSLRFDLSLENIEEIHTVPLARMHGPTPVTVPRTSAL